MGIAVITMIGWVVADETVGTAITAAVAVMIMPAFVRWD